MKLRISLSEWIVSAISFLLIATSLGILLVARPDPQKSVPVIVCQVEKITETKAGFLVEAKAVNHGALAAAQVRLTATLALSDQNEIRETVLDYVPAHSVKKAGFYFTSNPATGRLQIRADSYVHP
jgi:uncharacterized protein (TIGR02588 family)